MKNGTPLRRYRFRRTLLIAAVSGAIAAAFQGSNIPDDLVCDTVAQVCLIPPYSNDVLVGEGPTVKVGSTAVKHRQPLPCIRSWEGTYADGAGRYRTAYQFMESTYKSVSNARQDRLWPVLHREANWHEQDRAAWRLFELRGLSRWSDRVRSRCR